ncbi:MAG: Hsp20/alpha crystallin family protein [Bacillus subtilis]|nr:Hsp20/alpha crystallin family protein [Bacillus subtilis]
MQDEMSRILENAFEDLGLMSSQATGKEITWRPPVELNETNGNYQLKAELPGVNKDDIDIEITEENITLKAETSREKEKKEGNIYTSELRYGKFLRTIHLPSKIDNNKATAELKDGILTVTMPKTQEEQQKIKKLDISD